MFFDLNGRRVVISTTFGEGFRGTIETVNDAHLRLRDFEVAGHDGMGGVAFNPAEGIARIPLDRITWIQEL